MTSVGDGYFTRFVNPTTPIPDDILDWMKSRKDCHVHYEYSIRDLAHQFAHWHDDNKTNPDKLIIPSGVSYENEESRLRRHLRSWLDELHPQPAESDDAPVTSDMEVPYE